MDGTVCERTSKKSKRVNEYSGSKCGHCVTSFNGNSTNEHRKQIAVPKKTNKYVASKALFGFYACK